MNPNESIIEFIKNHDDLDYDVKNLLIDAFNLELKLYKTDYKLYSKDYDKIINKHARE